MLFDAEAKPALRSWLVRTLEPICDADPGALADYVTALLDRDVPEADLRQDLAGQLDEFLEKDGPAFIDTLFTGLRTKSYMPYTTSSPATPYASSSLAHGDGIPIPLDGMLSPSGSAATQGTKRSLEQDDAESRPIPKGPRLSYEGQVARYPNGRHDRSDFVGADQGMNGGGMGMGVGMNPGHVNARPRTYIPPDQMRGVCRDYHIKGYCARGAFCKFSHDDSAVIPGQLMPMNGGGMNGGGMPPPQRPFMGPMFGNNGGRMPFVGGPGMGGAAYDPHEARMDMRPQRGGMPGGKFHHTPRAPVLSRVQQEDGTSQVVLPRGSGELPVIQDLTPKQQDEEGAVAGGSTAPGTAEGEQQQRQPPRRNNMPYTPPGMGVNMGNMGMNMGMGMGGGQRMQMGQPHNAGHMGMPMDVEMGGPGGPPRPMMGGPHQMQSGGFRGGVAQTNGAPNGGAPGARTQGGTFNGNVQNFGDAPRPERRNDKTLVVEKIPTDRLSIGSVTEWFKKFGTVTNVAIDAMGAKALVSFDDHGAAREAWKSEDAVFGNRFVKVFWHRPMGGHGTLGAKMLAASAPLVKKVASAGDGPAATPSVSSSTNLSTNSINTTSARPGAAALAAKQQRLEVQIAEQKELMAKLDGASPEERKELFGKLRRLGEEIKKSSGGAPVPTVTARTASPAAPKAATPAPALPDEEDKERKKRELLDKELDMHAASTTAESSGDTTEELKAQLARLQAEAASLGIPEGAPAYAPRGGYRPYRGRGRGAPRGSYYRGSTLPARGGRPGASMKLDNRPKKLLVKNVPSSDAQAVKDWYEATGQMESFELADNDEAVVSFKSRSGAEQALAKGTNIPSGQVQISWYNGQPTRPSEPKSNGVSTPTPALDEVLAQEDFVDDPYPMPDEPPMARGWGEDDDDGMGRM